MFEQWKENLGVDITVLVLDQQQYYYWDGPAQGHLLDFGWIADYPDPQNFLDVLFHSETPNNLGSYSNPRLDALLEEARTEEDRDRRISLYRQAEQLLLDDVAAIPLWHGRDYVLVKPYVKDWHLSPQGVPDFLNVKLERE
jgi:oligopeptide transport system substrate-binding protein